MFLMCLELFTHQHPICENCQAVRYGNLNCRTCLGVRQWNRNPVVVDGRVVEGAVNMAFR